MDSPKIAEKLSADFDLILKEIKAQRMNRLLKEPRKGTDEAFDDLLQDIKTDGPESKFAKNKGGVKGKKSVVDEVIKEHEDGDNSSMEEEPGDDELNFEDFQDLIERVQELAERLRREHEREIVE